MLDAMKTQMTTAKTRWRGEGREGHLKVRFYFAQPPHRTTQPAPATKTVALKENYRREARGCLLTAMIPVTRAGCDGDDWNGASILRAVVLPCRLSCSEPCPKPGPSKQDYVDSIRRDAVKMLDNRKRSSDDSEQLRILPSPLMRSPRSSSSKKSQFKQPITNIEV